MAGKRFGFFGGRADNDSDFDGRPGNSGDSREYAQTYDPESLTERTNRPEIITQLYSYELQRAQDEAALDAHDAELQAQGSVKFFPSVGKFIIPRENTWAAHAELVKDQETGLAFNPDKYLYFDRIIAQKFGNPALWDPSEKDYEKLQGLRNNIAVLRNDTIGIYLRDGSFDPGDEAYIPHIAGIAAALGDALAAGNSWFKRPFNQSLSVDVASVEGTGAAEMYQYLLDVQTTPGIVNDISVSLGNADRSWGLPPMGMTPYSPEHLAAPPPRRIALTPEELAGACAELQKDQPHHERIATAGEATAQHAHKLQSVDKLEPPKREASVEEARTILRWLKNLSATDRDVEEWLDQGTPNEQVGKAEAIARLVEIYSGQLHKAEQSDATIRQTRNVQDANEAAGALAAGLSEHSLNLLPDGHPAIDRIEQLIDPLPQAWDKRAGQPVHRLLELLTAGLERTTGADVNDKSPAEQLMEISARIEKTAKKLRSVDTMEEAPREESLELAREIIRRLKNMKFSDKSAQEIVDTGRPEEKAEFAKQIEELVESYQSLLQEAAQSNPDILADQRIKDANAVVDCYAHSIKLMAAKEIPSSIASAQQISADVTQAPEEWKDLSKHTADRLAQSMEGALEKAMGDIEAAQQQQDDQAQGQSDAVQADQGTRRKKRKRRSSGKSSGGKQRKQAADLTSDDYVLKQGRFREDIVRATDMAPVSAPAAATPDKSARSKPATPASSSKSFGLNAKDMEAVRALGGNLLDINKQVGDIKNVAVDEKIAPDDKNFAQRSLDQQQRDRLNNNSAKL